MTGEGALDMILERGVRFRLPAPLWRKVFGPDTFTIHPPTVGVALAILREAEAASLADEDLVALFLESSISPRRLLGVKRIVATAVIASPSPKRRQLESLVKRLDGLLLSDLFYLYHITMTMCRGENFRKATLSVWALMKILRVRPRKKTRQEFEGSIASSESSVSGKETED